MTTHTSEVTTGVVLENMTPRQIVVELDKAVQRFRSRKHHLPKPDLHVFDAVGGPPPVTPAV